MSDEKELQRKLVGAGIVINAMSQVLLAQRNHTDNGGGLWEFPGGKKKPEETMEECIARELKEELGVEVDVGKLLIVTNHDNGRYHVELHAHWARILRGYPKSIDCADWAWVGVESLCKYTMGAADIEIAKAVVEQLSADDK